MKKDEIKKTIKFNESKIESKKQKIKDLQSEIRQLEERNNELRNEMILLDVQKAAIKPDDDISRLLSLGKYLDEQGINIADLEKMFPEISINAQEAQINEK